MAAKSGGWCAPRRSRMAVMTRVTTEATQRYVGRDAELAALLGLFDETVRTSRPHGAGEFSGPAGVGKSRLTREIVASAGWCGARPGSFGAAAFPAAVEPCMARSARSCVTRVASPSGMQLLAPGRSSRDTLADLGDLDSGEAELTTFALATTAGDGLPANPLDGLSAEAVGQRLSLAWPRFATACAAPSRSGHRARGPALGQCRVARDGRARGRTIERAVARPRDGPARSARAPPDVRRR